jgi:hypothetical protein
MRKSLDWRFRLNGGWARHSQQSLVKLLTQGILLFQFTDHRATGNIYCYCATLRHMKGANFSFFWMRTCCMLLGLVPQSFWELCGETENWSVVPCIGHLYWSNKCVCNTPRCYLVNPTCIFRTVTLKVISYLKYCIGLSFCVFLINTYKKFPQHDYCIHLN